MISAPELIGLILVGGQSSRMKKAKAYLDFGNGPQWQACGRALQPVCRKVYYSVSPQLKPPLPHGLPVIDDIFNKPIGPLGGIMSALKHEAQAALLVVACDTPYFDELAAQYLVSQRNPEKKATVFANQGQVEPLLGIYEPSIINELAIAWALGEYCPRVILSALDIEKVAPIDERWLTNVNHAHELSILRGDVHQKTVTVHYYASLREQVNRTEESLTTAALSVGELFLELKQRYGFLLEERSLRFAQNDRLVKSDEKIFDEDVIVFIPPVSGG